MAKNKDDGKKVPFGRNNVRTTENYSPEELEQIRTRAYFIWENSGKPEGRELEFWLQAKEEFRKKRGF